MQEKRKTKKISLPKSKFTEGLNYNFLKEPSNGLRYEVLKHKNVYLFQGDSLNPSLFPREFIDLIVTSSTIIVQRIIL